MLKQFLPQSYQKVKGLTSLEGAVLAFREQIPEDVLEDVMRLVRPYSAARLKGSVIWPHDPISAATIDQIIRNLLIEPDLDKAVEVTEGIEYAALMALANKLYDDYPDECYDYLSSIVCKHKDLDLRFNAAQFLFDSFEIPNEDQVRFASYLDVNSLRELYGWEISEFVRTELFENSADYKLHEELDAISGTTSIEGFDVTELFIEAKGNDQVEFYGSMDVDVNLQYGDGVAMDTSFPGNFKGYFDESGIYLTSDVVDTSNF